MKVLSRALFENNDNNNNKNNNQNTSSFSIFLFLLMFVFSFRIYYYYYYYFSPPLENVITAVEFDSTGEFLSIGYQCGQVVVFRNTSGDTYKFFTQFESHHPEFDFLTSLEIEEKINRIKWANNKYGNDAQLLLSTNGKP